MKNIKPIEILLVVMLGVIIWLAWGNQKQTNHHTIINNYRSDSLNSKKPYVEHKEDKKDIVINPRIVVNYPPVDLSAIKIEITDSLMKVFDSLHQKITMVNSSYLKQFPEASKLVYGKFTGDSLQLDLLGINGKIFTSSYPVNYLEYTYTYQNGKLRAEKVGKFKNIGKLESKLTLFAGYDVFYKAPLGTIEYNAEFRRVNGQIESGMIFQQKPQLFLQGKLGYRIR